MACGIHAIKMKSAYSNKDGFGLFHCEQNLNFVVKDTLTNNDNKCQ